MQWIEAAVAAESAALDGICERLAALGADGMVVEDEADLADFLENNREYWDYVDEALTARYRGVSRVKFYLPDDAAGRALLAQIRAGLGRELSARVVDDSAWENAWQENYPPVEAGERLLIVPEWLEPPETGRILLRLNPGLLSGTGLHPATQLALAALEHYAGAGKRVLDLGCGSGILSIGALLLGCAGAAGCDLDPKAPAVVAENAAYNPLPAAPRILTGDVLRDAGLRRALGTGYDILLANIAADVILPLIPLVRPFAAPGAVFVCSGILEGREREIEAALRQAGMTVREHLHRETWHAFAASL